MRIDRFAVRDFRKLVGRVEIDGLDPGLTVIVGDNEEGKSTLLKALQAAFFDRHGLGGAALTEMMPFGSAGLRPAIEVDFELDGAHYRLEKTFGSHPSASLEGGGGLWKGDAAEERLRELLGFSQPGRGPAKEAHRGLAGLLWVEQGRAFAPLTMNPDSQTVLREAIEETVLRKAIEGEVGQVLGGERGRRLLGAVEAKAREYFTPTWREREALKRPRERVGALETEYRGREAELTLYNDKVNRLEDLNRRLERYEREGSLASAKEAVARAEEDVRRLEDAATRTETARARMEEAHAVAEAAEGERERRARFAAEAAAAEEESGKAAAASEALEPERAATERALAEAEGRFAEANRALETAETAWQAAQRARRQTEIAGELRELDARLEQAGAIEREIDAERQALAAIPLDDDALAGLRGLYSRQAELKAALDAAAAALRFMPERGMTVSHDGQPVDTGGPVRVAEKTTFRLQGFGSVEVTPGGRDIVRLRADLTDTGGRLRGELRRFGLDDLAAAEAAMRAKQDLERRIERLSGQMKGAAPDGVDSLRERARKQREALAAVGGGGELQDAGKARAAEAAAEEARAMARRAVDEAVQNRDAARTNRERAESAWIEADAQQRQKAETADRQRTALEQLRRETPDAALVERAAAAGRELAERETAHESLLAEYTGLGPEGVELELERAQDALKRRAETIGKDRQAARDLAVELRTLGQGGLAEELQRIEGELEIARRDLTRIEADATAWKLLLDTLRDAEHDAKETILGPVRERLRPYLQMLFPETEVRLDEDDLEIAAIVRNGVEEKFDSLSIGAREQIAVLIRLALADFLREKGKPAAVILDDALVNSDDERFRRMQLALRKAAQSLQIVVLTCHETRYESLGAKTIRLADCRTAG